MYRDLTVKEIETLLSLGSRCNDWSKVKVAKEGFVAENIRYAVFSGDIKIGRNDGKHTFEGGLEKDSAIYNATLHNCNIGDNVYISNVKNYIANYNLGNNVLIDNVEAIYCSGISSFGNGVSVAVLNETGGRDVLIYDHLSAHLAYILAMYRHKEEALNVINNYINSYTNDVSSDKGYIGDNSKIMDSGKIINVKIGEYCVIDGAAVLKNGSVNSKNDAPCFIGRDVIAEDFIISSSSKITDGAIIDKCFIGQGCALGKQYSAENSLFFANCMGMHGEACAIFAGPYTVTHHKSTLLIAGLFSFLNAGSGSNQSNHMYKLGPIHQGVVERGSKTTSDSYLLWPAKIGAFSIVMGRHYKNSDTSDLPFSYIIESESETIIVPAANLKSVGTIRDAKKWPKRDKRKGNNKLDQINFNLLSPYTINKMINAISVLEDLERISGKTSDTYSYQSGKIKNSSLKKGVNLYKMGVTKFLGNSLIKRLEHTKFKDINQIRERLKPDTNIGSGTWLDMAGLIAPKSEIEKLLNDIETQKVKSLEIIHQRFVQMHQNYYTYEWTWAIQHICKWINKQIHEITGQDILNLVAQWEHSVVTLDKMLYEDAKKEFTLSTKTGFGIDGDEQEKDMDFGAVRGEFEKNDFVIEVLEHIDKKTALANEIRNRISPEYK